MATQDGLEWAGESGQVSELRGSLFKYACLGAVSFALLSVLVLLLYVAADALRPFSADPGWHLVFFLTLVLPALGLAGSYVRSEEPAGGVAVATVGIPIVGLLVAAAVAVVLSIGLLSVAELFAMVIATAVAVGVVLVHARNRPRAAFERLVVLVGAPTVALLGLAPLEVVWLVNTGLAELGTAVRIPLRVISLRELVLASPVLPLGWMMLVGAVTVPVAGALGVVVARRRERTRDGVAFVAGAAAFAALGAFVGPALGVDPTVWILVATFAVAPLGVYVEGVVRREDGAAGLAFPVVLVGGVLAGAVLVEQFGFAPPEPWLDWQFLTSVHSRTPDREDRARQDARHRLGQHDVPDRRLRDDDDRRRAGGVPRRRRRRDLPRGVRARQRAGGPVRHARRDQHREPRRRAVGRVRPARAGAFHPVPGHALRVRHRRRTRHRAAHPSDRHHLRAGGDPRGAGRRSARCRTRTGRRRTGWARRDGRRFGTSCCPKRCRAS